MTLIKLNYLFFIADTMDKATFNQMMQTRAELLAKMYIDEGMDATDASKKAKYDVIEMLLETFTDNTANGLPMYAGITTDKAPPS